MNDVQGDPSWVSPGFQENRRKFPVEELRRYAGQYVAFNEDGSAILAADVDDATLYRKILDAGLNPGRVVIDFIDPGNSSQY